MLTRVAGLFACLAMATMLLMALHVCLSVTVRWITGREIAGTLEVVTYYYMVALVFLPMACVELSQSHIRADLAARLLTGRFGRFVECATQIGMAMFFGLLCWKSLQSALERMAVGELVQTGVGFFPIWPSRWLLPVGLGLAMLYAAVLALRIIRGMPVPGVDHEPIQEI